MTLNGKIALVTGGSRGIGAAISRRLAQDGATIIVNYVSNSAAADSLVKELNSLPNSEGKSKCVKADVGNLEEGKKLISDIVNEFGRLDYLILNAGIMPMIPLQQVNEKNFAQLFDTNVKGPLFLVQSTIPHLSPGGRILFFSSNLTNAWNIHSGYILYLATKGAIEQMARVLSREPDVVSKKITVNVISPGPTETELFMNGKPEEIINRIKSMSPFNGLAQPEDIAGAVRFLVGDEGRWITGQNWKINGGAS